MLSRLSFSIAFLSLVWTSLLLNTPVHGSAINARSPMPSQVKAPSAPSRKGSINHGSNGASGSTTNANKSVKKGAAAQPKCFGASTPRVKRAPSKGKGVAIDACGIAQIAQAHPPTCGAAELSFTFKDNTLQPPTKGKAAGTECDMVYDMNLLGFALDPMCAKFKRAVELLGEHVTAEQTTALLAEMTQFATKMVTEISKEPANHRYLSSAEHTAKQRAFSSFSSKQSITKDQTMKNVAEYLAADLATFGHKVSGWQVSAGIEMTQMRNAFMKDYNAVKVKMCKKDATEAFDAMRSLLPESKLVLGTWNTAVKKIGVTKSKAAPKKEVYVHRPESPSTDSNSDSE